MNEALITRITGQDESDFGEDDIVRFDDQHGRIDYGDVSNR